MLKVRRKAGQEVIINRDVKVLVLAVGSRNVDLGVEAPADVPVWRSELGHAEYDVERHEKLTEWLSSGLEDLVLQTTDGGLVEVAVRHRNEVRPQFFTQQEDEDIGGLLERVDEWIAQMVREDAAEENQE